MTEENDKMKDLLIKLQILTNGLVEERKKSKNYLEKIKDLEKILQKKDNEIVDLTKQKFELQASLTFEKSKKSTNQNKKKKLDEAQISEYEQIINNQGSKLNELNRQLKNEHDSFEIQKKQYQELIKLGTDQLEDLKKKFEKIDLENTELSKKQVEVNDRIKKFEKVEEEYNEKIKTYENDLKVAQNRNVELQNELDKKKIEFEEKEKEIEQYKKKSDEMAHKLNEMKLALINKEIKEKAFKVEMIKPKKVIEIIFKKNFENENYEFVIKGKNKKEDEHINFLDVSSFEINEKDKNRIDIEYTVSKNFLIYFYSTTEMMKVYL